MPLHPSSSTKDGPWILVCVKRESICRLRELTEAAIVLRRAVDTHGKVTIDSVDALPNVDVPLPMQQLKLILGDDTTLRLHELAQCYLDTTTDMPGQSIICYSPSSDTPTPPRRAMLAGSFALLLS